MSSTRTSIIPNDIVAANSKGTRTILGGSRKIK